LQIQAPTLILGGEKDLCLGGDASRELASRIPGAQLKMYPDQGHGLYEEAPAFQQTILDFLLK
jgi:pimeloyl-ACP methyl ester carboxylesterase